MMYVKVLLLCVLLTGATTDDDAGNTGAEYLRNVMNRLQMERAEGHPIELGDESAEDVDIGASSMVSHNITPPMPMAMPSSFLPQASFRPPSMPSDLTAEELTAIYNAAVAKLSELQNKPKPISAFHHPTPPPPVTTTGAPHTKPVLPMASGTLPGFYYYYYPIKTFLKAPATPMPAPTSVTTPKPMKMEATVTMVEQNSKAVEPLFMAVSGFIGMALFFIFSVLFVPKFGKLRAGGENTKESTKELLALGKLVYESMDGKDCAEKISCEIAKILKGANLDDKPLKLLEVVLPPKLSKQINLIRKAAASKRQDCEYLKCRFGKPVQESKRPETININKVKRKWWSGNKGQAAHYLWMQRFENGTRFRQPENIWDGRRPKNSRRRPLNG